MSSDPSIHGADGCTSIGHIDQVEGVDNTENVQYIKGMKVPSEVIALLERMNRRHAVIAVGGKLRFLDLLTSPDLIELPYQFLDKATFEGLYESTPDVLLMKYRQNNTGMGTWEPTYKALPWVWRHWEKRRTYHRVGFYPGGNHHEDIFNLWEGWRIKARKGSWKHLLKHLYVVLCRRNRTKFKYLIDWLSHVMQTTGSPDRRSPVSLVVHGVKGSGKSIVFDYVVQLFGNNGMTIAKKDQLIGQFNKHLQMSLFVVVEEAVYAHDKQGEGPLKDLLTRKKLTIEPKGVDAFESRNYGRFAFISNDKLAVPMTLDERRYQPFHVSPDRKGDKTWFDAIVKEMESGGLSAMMYDLMNRTYDEALIRSPLENEKDISAMRAEILEAPVRFAMHWVLNGYVAITNSQGEATPLLHAAQELETASADAATPWLPSAPFTNESDGQRLLALEHDRNFVGSTQMKAVYDKWCVENLNVHERRKASRSIEALSKEIREALPFVEKARISDRRGISLPSAAECLTESRKNPNYRAYLAEIGDNPDE